MPKIGLVLIPALVGLILTGCSTGPSNVVLTISSDPSSGSGGSPEPAFLTRRQTAIDKVPSQICRLLGVLPASSRYQGSWLGRRVFLATGKSGVMLIAGSPANVSSWVGGGDQGNHELSLIAADSEGKLEYIPTGTAHMKIPKGWKSLSKFIIVN